MFFDSKMLLIQKFKSIARAANLIIDQRNLFGKKPFSWAQGDRKWAIGDPEKHENPYKTRGWSKKVDPFAIKNH